jgi:glutaminyl-peptide cyclotransferase
MFRRLTLFFFFAAAILPFAFAADTDTYKVIHTYPHDAQAFTQGLIFLDGQLYESTGLNGHSSLRSVDLETGKAQQYKEIPSEYFAEGLTNWGSTLIQLTWKAHIAFVYDRFSFRQLKTLSYTGEGWGLAQDGKNIILSDGSSTLRFLDPSTFKVVRTIKVTDNGKAIDQLNELEYIHGEIYSNIWYSNKIARISPQTGKVLGWIDLTGIISPSELSSDGAVLNGIAYDAKHDRLFVTGKLWPKLFEIKVVPKSARK